MPSAYAYDASSQDVASIITTEYKILDSYLTRPASLPTILPFTRPETDPSNSASKVTFLSFVPSSQRDDPRWKSLYQDLQYQRNLVVDDVRRRTANEVNKAPSLSAKFCQIWQSEFYSGQGGRTRKAKANTQTRKRKRRAGDQATENDGSGHDSEADATEDEPPQQEEGQDLDCDEGDQNFDVSLDTAFHGPTGGTLSNSEDRNYQDSHFLDACERSVQSLQAEITDIEKQQDQIVSELEELVGNLSDLRYGKFQRASGVADTNEKDHNQSHVSNDSNTNGTVEGNVIDALQSLRKALEISNDRDTNTAA